MKRLTTKSRKKINHDPTTFTGRPGRVPKAVDRGSIMKTKVLQLEWWMTSPATLEECVDPDAEMLPVFNRDGYYLHRGVCWFEVGGKAYKTSATQFRYVVNLLHVWQRYNQRQIEAMRLCLQEGVATKQQREALHAWDDFQGLTEIKRDGARTRLRFTAFKEKQA